MEDEGRRFVDSLQSMGLLSSLLAVWQWKRKNEKKRGIDQGGRMNRERQRKGDGGVGREREIERELEKTSSPRNLRYAKACATEVRRAHLYNHSSSMMRSWHHRGIRDNYRRSSGAGVSVGVSRSQKSAAGTAAAGGAGVACVLPAGVISAGDDPSVCSDGEDTLAGGCDCFVAGDAGRACGAEKNLVNLA